jgi:hypothetical protein
MIASVVVGFFALLLWLIGAALSLAAFGFWLWMLINAITNKGLGDGERIVWVLVIIFLPFIGSLIYFFIGRSRGGAAI